MLVRRANGPVVTIAEYEYAFRCPVAVRARKSASYPLLLYLNV